MEKIVLNMVKLLLIHMKENNILEINLDDFKESFFKFKNSEEYGKFFYSYIYDENCLCQKFERELNTLTKNNQIFKYNKYIYIYTINTECKSHFSDELNNLVDKMVNDFVKFNMEKIKVKAI